MFQKLILVLLLISSTCISKCQEFRVDTTHNPTELVLQYFLKNTYSGIKIRNIKYNGIKNALGSFIYTGNNNIFTQGGIVLSSGNAIEAMGPNTSTASNENYFSGDDDLGKIVNSETFDAAIIEFDFISLSDSINFIFQFASEEYPEYVEKGVSDVFGFFIKDKITGFKKNIATFSKKNIPITVDLINQNINSDLYISNNNLEYKINGDVDREISYYETNKLFQFDGFTKPILSGLSLEPFKWYNFKIAIADIGDRKFDSWIFLKGNSFVSCGNIKEPSKKDIYTFFNYSNTDSIIIEEKANEIHIVAPIYFDFNESLIKMESIKSLEYLISLLKYSKYSVTINGYTDKIGTQEYNLKLSSQRAEKIKTYFIEHGIEPERIQSYGKGELINKKGTDKSRKVEFILYERSSL